MRKCAANITFTPQKSDMLKYLNFLAELRTEEELEVLTNSMDFLEYSEGMPGEATQLLRTWCNLLVRGMKGYYSSYSGQVYFERKSGGQMEPEEILDLQNLIMDIYKITGKNQLDWLDLGCGNGQQLAHIHKHMPNIHVKGIELSQLGYAICKERIESEKLPHDSVILGDMRQMPYASQSFDVVYAFMSMHSLPYVPGSGIGMEEAIAEVERILKPGGVAVIVTPEGGGRDYLLPRQFMDSKQLTQLAGNTFEIVSSTIRQDKPSCGNINGTLIPSGIKFNYDKLLYSVLKKK